MTVVSGVRFQMTDDRSQIVWRRSRAQFLFSVLCFLTSVLRLLAVKIKRITVEILCLKFGV